jgi:hypothetical protein
MHSVQRIKDVRSELSPHTAGLLDTTRVKFIAGLRRRAR